jgi:hypothetical protein
MAKVKFSKKQLEQLEETLNINVDVPRGGSIDRAVRDTARQVNTQVGNNVPKTYSINSDELTEDMEGVVPETSPNGFPWAKYSIQGDGAAVLRKLKQDMVTAGGGLSGSQERIIKNAIYALEELSNLANNMIDSGNEFGYDETGYVPESKSFVNKLVESIKKVLKEDLEDDLNYNNDPDFGTYDDPFRSEPYYKHERPEGQRIFEYIGTIVLPTPKAKSYSDMNKTFLVTLATDINTAMERFEQYPFHGELLQVETGMELYGNLTDYGKELFDSGEVVESDSGVIGDASEGSGGIQQHDKAYQRLVPRLRKENKENSKNMIKEGPKVYTKKQIEETRVKKLRANANPMPKKQVEEMLKNDKPVLK